MPFATKTHAEHLADLLAQLQSLIPNLDVGGASDSRFKASALAHALEGLSSHIDWVHDQIFPDSADPENLERWAATRGITRNPASAASGYVAATGTDGTTIPVGSTLTHADGTVFETTASAVWDGAGHAVVAVVAQEVGEAGNLDAGVALSWSPVISLIDAAATATTSGGVTGIVGGLEVETDSALLVRYLLELQSPPAGGTETDWRRWALEVPGVTEAFTFPVRRGLGTADLVCYTVDGSGNRAVPGPSLVTDIETHVDSVRPVTTKDWLLATATTLAVDVTVDDLLVLVGYDPATVATAVASAITAFFATLDPGETLYLNVHLHQVITGVPGVKDYTLTAPAANVEAAITSSIIELLVAGTITVNPAA